MCGRLNVIDDAGVRDLCQQLDIQLWPDDLVQSRFIRATDSVSIIRQKGASREMLKARWWLLQDIDEQGFKPSKYTSFNSRYDKLNQPGSAAYQPFRQSRCIIPVHGFGETEFVNKKPLHYYDLFAKEGKALALGGLYKEWTHPVTQQHLVSCSVVTLPPHSKLMKIHSKAMPLILSQSANDNGTTWMDLWLDTSIETEALTPLLSPFIPQDLVAQQIDKPSSHNPLGQLFTIHSDVA